MVVAVIVAVPTALAVTTPVLDTVATEVLELLHITLLLVAVDGVTVAVRVTVSFALSDAVVLFKEIPVAAVATTVTLQVALRLLPSVVVAVISAVPTL